MTVCFVTSRYRENHDASRVYQTSSKLEILECCIQQVSFMYCISNINGLLTEREVCTVKYQTEVFLVWTERRRSEVHTKKQRSDISQYRPNKRGQ
jgi:hypothetical protein